jgi:hypothetical protein
MFRSSADHHQGACWSKSSLMMIIWWSKHVRVILSISMCDIWINVLLQTSALVGPLHTVIWHDFITETFAFHCSRCNTNCHVTHKFPVFKYYRSTQHGATKLPVTPVWRQRQGSHFFTATFIEGPSLWLRVTSNPVLLPAGLRATDWATTLF